MIGPMINMVGNPTQSRSRPLLISTNRYWQGGVAVPNSQIEPTTVNQTGEESVNSYRTIKGIDASADSAFSQTSGSQAAFVKELKSEDSYRSPYDGVADNGHEFWSERNQITYPNQDTQMFRPNSPYGDIRFSGFARPYGPVEYPNLILPSSAKVNADGRKLIEMSIPTKAEAGLATFLGELRERLPSFIGMTSIRDGATAKSAGGEHLNIQFGLKPFIKDLQKMARSILAFSKETKQFKRDSGQSVRRRRRLASETSFNQVSETAGGSASISSFYDLSMGTFFFDQSQSLVSASVADNFSSEVWFSGAYTYYLSEAHSFLGQIERYEQLANHLLGTRITADTIWQLTPWSWLFDWFSDAGTFVSNVCLLSSDSTVLRYGYVMHENHATRIHTVHGMVPYSGGSCPGSLSTITERIRKMRTRATPYGFGVDLESLTLQQSSILAALGLSKRG